MYVLVFSLAFLSINSVDGRSGLLRTAPEICPIEDGNLLDVKLFVRNHEHCFQLCEKYDECSFYRFYESKLKKPAQCFLFTTCGRHVEEASSECHINKENTLLVHAFIQSNLQCQLLCQQNRKCGYYKYTDSEPEVLEKESQGRLSRQTNSLSPFCYLLKSCDKRMIDKFDCALGKNNFLDVKFFVQSGEDCQFYCQETEGCRYYAWYPIEKSSSPLYCYLYQQCAPSDEEPRVALIIGGRHPGHYYIDNKEHSDLIMRNNICIVPISQEIKVSRAGGTAEYVGSQVLFCGGRNDEGLQSSCLSYNPSSDVWSFHSNMIEAHEEASSVVINDTKYVIGGINSTKVESYQFKDEEERNPKSSEDEKNNTTLKWRSEAPLPEVRARACSVTENNSTIYLIGGHDDVSLTSLASVMTLHLNEGIWKKDEIPPMNTPRINHACLFVEFEKTKGILVTGGLGSDHKILDSVEFYDMTEQKWSIVSSLKIGRMEHVMNYVYGIPTVAGGLAGNEFLSSIEQFDKSSASWNVPLERDWRVINHVLNGPRYEMASASIPVSQMNVCDSDS